MNPRLNKFKYIINSGCSYGRMADSIKRPLETFKTINYAELDLRDLNEIQDKWFVTDENIVVIDVSLPSQSSEYITDSTIHSVNYLLNLGVLPENIYCFIEWTQWSRITIPPNKFVDYQKYLNFSDNRNNNVTILGENNPNQFITDALKGLNITSCGEMFNIGKIGDMVYITPTHTNFTDIGNPTELESYLEKAISIEQNISEEVKVKNYINNILRLQYFLKSKNIPYDCCFMQGSLSGWFDVTFMYSQYPETSNENSYCIFASRQDTIYMIQDRTPMDKTYDVENVITSVKKDIDLIDWNHFWTYETKDFRRGGYDEWCIDKFGIGSMIDPGYIFKHLFQNTKFSASETITNFGYHPNVNLYKLLWNDIAKHCTFLKMDEDWCKEIERRFFEDKKSNEDLPTIHGVTLSESYLYKTTKHKKYSFKNGTGGIL